MQKDLQTKLRSNKSLADGDGRWMTALDLCSGTLDAMTQDAELRWNCFNFDNGELIPQSSTHHFYCS